MFFFFIITRPPRSSRTYTLLPLTQLLPSRVEAQQDVWIPHGHRQRNFPDFIVGTDRGDHWMVEGKADDRANDPDVIQKKTAGFEWSRFANDSGDATATWHYLFATATAIKQAGGT